MILMAEDLPKRSLVLLVFFIYGLHAFSALTGLLTPAFIVTAFLTGWPSLLAVLLSYLKRFSAQGTYLESHFAFLIRTFWLALLWLIVAGLCMITLIGFFPGVGIILIVGLWVLYRLLKGLSYLLDENPIPEIQ
jgi:uncharacterized membrane protein